MLQRRISPLIGKLHLGCAGLFVRTSSPCCLAQLRWNGRLDTPAATVSPSMPTATVATVASQYTHVQLVAARLNKMKRVHARQEQSPKAMRLQLQAWRDLQMLPDADVEAGDARSVALLLNSWAYFSRFWEKGIDGPTNPLPLLEKDPDDVDYGFKAEVDLCDESACPSAALGLRKSLQKLSPLAQKDEPLPPRHDPLNDTIEMDA